MDQLIALCDWYEAIETNIENQPHQASLDKEMKNRPKDPTLNRILFGAAGTGKTYHSVNHALSIIEGKCLKEIEQEQRDHLKQRFDAYVKQGQIRFVTFHQSFSYEDFVEGIRAESDLETEQLAYPVKAGVFKEICDQASGQQVQDDNVDQVLEKFLDEISINALELSTVTSKKIKVSYIGQGHVIHCKPYASESDATYRANINSIRQILNGEEPDILYNSSYVYAITNYLREKVVPVQNINTSKPYVLIIDEINRGNLSRIFGELITLIEPSKRQGAAEALSVTLPYSKKPFSVPDNVYIIGTMNSSDRSLTGLDLALRRRFKFIEMPPNPQLLNDVHVKDDQGSDAVDVARMLDTMNRRIEILLDRDHCIGHAYFMPLKDNPCFSLLKEIFEQNIIPLLQEYFFDDWEQINLVLNENGMLKQKYRSGESSALFKNGTNLGDIWSVDSSTFDDIQNYQNIYAAFDQVTQ